MSVFVKAMNSSFTMEDDDSVNSTLTYSAPSCEEIVRDSKGMKNFIEKCFLLGISPHTNFTLYQECLEYVSQMISDLFIEDTFYEHDNLEFDNFMRMLITNPDRPFFLKDDLLSNFNFFCAINPSEKSTDERVTTFTAVLERIFKKHEDMPVIKKSKNSNPTLRVGNLMTCHTREEIMGQLRLAFGKYGVIRDIKVPMDYGTGNPRGYAFIEFMEASMADHALQMTQDKLKIGPRLLRIDYALGEKRGFA